MRKGQPLCRNPNVNMPTSRLLIRTWRRSAQGRSHHFPRAVREQPPLQYEGLTGTLPADVCWDCENQLLWKPEMFTAYPLIFIFLWPFTLLFSNLLWLFTLFVAVHPLLSSPNQKKKHSFPPLASSLPSSDPGRSLLVKHSTEFRVKWLTQLCFVCLWWIDSRKTSVMRVI